MTIHMLKTDPLPFSDVASGVKTFELRPNDRGFQVGDALVLVETRHSAAEMHGGAVRAYTGRRVLTVCTYITQSGVYGLRPGFAVMGIGPVKLEQVDPADAMKPPDLQSIPVLPDPSGPFYEW